MTPAGLLMLVLFDAALGVAPPPATPREGGATKGTNAATRTVGIAGGEQGIGFDDLGFSPDLRRVLVPAGGTGRIELIDPDTAAVRSLALRPPSTYQGGHAAGITSVDGAGKQLAAIDRDSQRVDIVDADTAAVVTSAKLSGHPDYVRWAADAREVWVTEPDEEQIEVFSFDGHSNLKRLTAIRVLGGPESLVMDRAGKRAFAHRWAGATVVIDVATHALTATWPNTCRGSRGIAFDDETQTLLVGCAEGRLVALDAKGGGRVVSSIATPAGVDIIAWSPSLRHVYVPGAKAGAMAIIGVTAGGLKTLEIARTVKGAHCAASDDRGHAWVCDPSHGRLLVITDSHARS